MWCERVTWGDVDSLTKDLLELLFQFHEREESAVAHVQVHEQVEVGIRAVLAAGD